MAWNVDHNRHLMLDRRFSAKLFGRHDFPGKALKEFVSLLRRLTRSFTIRRQFSVFRVDYDV